MEGTPRLAERGRRPSKPQTVLLRQMSTVGSNHMWRSQIISCLRTSRWRISPDAKPGVRVVGFQILFVRIKRNLAPKNVISIKDIGSLKGEYLSSLKHLPDFTGRTDPCRGFSGCSAAPASHGAANTEQL
jgi:hypothetical protein